ncbi:GGDEF domain-containing protein [Pengzhenrongella sp.]|uniref:tetratricopeptide repeat-containing diguanylate cyclase n=1 Tax=Pengzhenrongella sp. TaxID=2888820 RepID=UPI002F91D114
MEARPSSSVLPEPPNFRALVDELEDLHDSDARTCADRSVAALTLAREYADDDAEMQLSYFAACAYHLLAEDTAALAAAARTEEIAAARGEIVWQSRALVCRALVHSDLGEPEDAVDLLSRALDLCRSAGDDAGTARVLNSLGAVYIDMVHFAPRAAQALTEARRTWLATGDTDHASMVLTNLARMYVVTSARLVDNPRGAQAAARHALGFAQQAVQEADAAGIGRTCIDARLAVVGALMLTGDLEAAGKAISSARAMLNRFPSTRQEIAYRIVRCRWLVRTVQLDLAVLEVCDGLDLCEELNRPSERIELLKSLVDAYEGRGEIEAALHALHEVHDLTAHQSEVLAERRAELLSSRMDIERAQGIAEAAMRRATALEMTNSRLEHEATHDALTGIANRRSLDVTLASWTAGARTFGCALVDIDHFKRVNDQWSHQAGDRVLARLAKVLAGELRGVDVAARYGGEEFALLIDGVDAITGFDTCERTRIAVESTTWEDLIPGGQITISIGLTLHRADDQVDALLARADAALYAAKDAGRNRVMLAGA